MGPAEVPSEQKPAMVHWGAHQVQEFPKWLLSDAVVLLCIIHLYNERTKTGKKEGMLE